MKQVRDGGPSPEQLRKDLEAQGKNYELTLDFANRAHGVTTRYKHSLRLHLQREYYSYHVILALSRYNKDGSVGPQIVRVEDLPTKEDIMAQQKETEQALEGDLVL